MHTESELQERLVNSLFPVRDAFWAYRLVRLNSVDLTLPCAIGLVGLDFLAGVLVGVLVR
jgi:hypothetical protein